MRGVKAPTYTVEEANQILPRVREHVERVVALSDQLPDLQDRHRIARYRSQREGAGRAESDAAKRLQEEVQEAERAFLEALRALEQLGIQLKDPREGLIDFLSYRDGELVELCWKLGEERVSHWHPIGEGYPGRRSL
jgi:hypothetical protein